MRRVCVVVTSRPSYSRVRTALLAIQEHPDLELQLVVATSALLDRFGSVIDFVEEDGFEVTDRVFNLLEGGSPLTMTKTTGLGVIEMASVLDRLDPDLALVIADRFEILSAAIAAAYMNIPLAHLQGGEITGSIDEKVRHSVTKLSDLHLVCTQQAAERVLRMGEHEQSIFVTGCPSIDIAADVVAGSPAQRGLLEQYGGVGAPVDIESDFLVVLQHPVTTEFERARDQVLQTLQAAMEAGLPVLWFWPNPDAGTDGTSDGIRSFRERYQPEHIHFFKNLRPDDFLRVLVASRGIVGNSSVAIRECSYLGVPAVNIGTRQAGRDRGHNVLDVEHDAGLICDAMRAQVAHGPYPRDLLYGHGEAGTQIAQVLASAPLTVEKRLAY